MSGRYNKAPLVYIGAAIKFTYLPSFSKDQHATLSQLMMKKGFTRQETREMSEISFDFQIEKGEIGEKTRDSHKFNRYGFFAANNQTSVIIDRNSVEWRTTENLKFIQVAKLISETYQAIQDQFEVLNSAMCSELELSYADLIVAKKGRKLSDYFIMGEKALPISCLSSTVDSIQELGSVQVNRIINSTTRSFSALEQLPIKNGKPVRYLPQQFMERDPLFGMDIKANIPEEYESSEQKYALLASQAAKAVQMRWGDLKLEEDFEDLKKIIGDDFRGLVNKKVCDIDWEYEE